MCSPLLVRLSEQQLSITIISVARALSEYCCSMLSKNNNMTSASYPTVTHVIFDLDGLILDTEPVYLAKGSRWRQLLAEHGLLFTEELRVTVQGLRDTDCAAAVTHATGLPLTPQQVIQRLRDILPDALAHAALKPGVERLIRHLHGSGVPIAVATSSSNYSLQLKLSSHQELMSLFSHIVSASSDPEVRHGKPHPDVFLTCAARFSDKLAPEKCLVFEDAVSGVVGARAAGMQAVMVPPAFLPRSLTADATLVLPSLLNFQPQLFGLPPFPDDQPY